MAIKHKRQATRPPTPDPDAIQSADWNDDHEIEGAIGELSELAAQPNTLLFLNDDAKGALVPLSALARDIIALALERDILNRLGALAKSGDTMSGALDMDGNRITGLAAPVTSTDAVTKEYADALISAVSGALAFKGEWDASAGTFPSAGAVKVGWFYKVSVAGTVGGKFFSVGDDVFAVVDNPSTTVYAANWLKIEGSITLAEVEAAVGFSFGTGAALNAGTSVGNLVQVQTGGKLPALDGSLLTNLPSGNVTANQISDASANGKSLIKAADFAAMLALLGIGSAGLLDTGTTANKVVKLDGSGKLPAVDGSQITNLPGGATVGGVGWFPANAAPTGWLKANGTLLNRTTYAALYAYAAASGNIVAEGSWSSNKGAFSTGDGSTTFRIPDLRGIFIRGWDDSAGVDSGRTIGSSQADDNKAHTHTTANIWTNSNSEPLQSGSGINFTRGATVTSSSSGGTEARPKNVALLGCIRYAA